jgi:plastocyanin
VRVGTRVTWTNRQADIQHTVTAGDGSFGSDPLSTGASFSHVFTVAGTYAYHCSIHTDMTGTVTVTR